jgi:hypothetical protein
MRKKFAAFATAGLVALVAGPALPAPGGKNSEIDALKDAVAVLEGRVDTLEGEVDANTGQVATNTGQVGTNTDGIGVLDLAVVEILSSLAGIDGLLDDLDERLITVEEDIHSPLFDIVIRSSTQAADPLGAFIYQDCEAGEMALGGSISTPDVGETWSVDTQGFNWAGGIGDWATGWAASVTGPVDQYPHIFAVCATVNGGPDFGVNPLTNS